MEDGFSRTGGREGWFDDDLTALRLLCTLLPLFLYHRHLRLSGVRSRSLGAPALVDTSPHEMSSFLILSNFVPIFFLDCFGYLIPFNFKMGFTISARNTVRILIRLALNLNITLGNIVILTIFSL